MEELDRIDLDESMIRSLRAWHLFFVLAISLANAGLLLFSLALMTLDYLTAVYGMLVGLSALLGLFPIGSLWMARSGLAESEPAIAYASRLLRTWQIGVVWVALCAVLLVASFPLAVIAAALLQGSGL
jgi:hypothetical protein